MNTYIALLRGINVLGRNSLPMKELVGLLEGIGAKNVKTYIQSGNAIFRCSRKEAAAMATRLTEQIQQRHGFAPRVLILELDALESAIAANPFPAAAEEPKTLHLGFLAAPPQNVDLAKLAALKKTSEHFLLAERVFYLHTPEGFGTSKLPEAAEKVLAVPMSYRNWRTVCALRDLARP